MLLAHEIIIDYNYYNRTTYYLAIYTLVYIRLVLVSIKILNTSIIAVTNILC